MSNIKPNTRDIRRRQEQFVNDKFRNHLLAGMYEIMNYAPLCALVTNGNVEVQKIDHPLYLKLETELREYDLANYPELQLHHIL